MVASRAGSTLPTFNFFAVKTFLIMNTDNPSALGAFVFLSLICKEISDSSVFNLIEALYHAHSKVFSVAFIQAFEPVTWKTSAFETKSYLAFAQFRAISFKKCALFVPRTTSDTMNDFASLSRNVS